MADSDTKTPPAPTQERKFNPHKMMTVDIVNPCKHRRIIDRGDEKHSQLVIDVGETVRNVEIAEIVVKELRTMAKKVGADKELKIYGAGQAPVSAKPKDESVDDDADEDADDGE